MASLSQAGKDRLATCHVDIQRVINEVIRRANEKGTKLDLVVLCGHRTQAEQTKAVADGNSKTPWPRSRHNSLPSEAVDVWPWTPEGKLDWKDIPAGARLMGYIQAVAEDLGVELEFGMDWDGDWRSAGYDPSERFYDGPHLQLKRKGASNG